MDLKTSTLENDLITNDYTRVFYETVYEFNAPHHFAVQQLDIPYKILSQIDFQKGPIEECGVNGVMNEDLIAMVICRLEGFQASAFQCRENAVAITKLEEALMWLRKRTDGRKSRGVEGTHFV